MSPRLRWALICGCLGVAALTFPRAVQAARAGFGGPYHRGDLAVRAALDSPEVALERSRAPGVRAGM